MAEIEFPKGLIAKEPHSKAPDYVKMNLSIKREELITWLESKTDEWLNLTVKESKGGKLYIAVDTWKKGAGSGDHTPPDEVTDLEAF